nr:MFS transporter [Paraburkholderia caribensis]
MSPFERRPARFAEIWEPPYRRRTLVMLTFHLIQSVGFYGFASWVPSLLSGKGITVTHSLLYSFIIAIANPIGPLIGMLIADRIERKTMIVASAFGVALFGGTCAVVQSSTILILLGVLLTFCNTLLSAAYHAYQTELFPTRIRAHAVGFVYSLSRLSAMFSGFFIAFTLRNFGASGVFGLITSVMVIVMLTIGFFGPRTNKQGLETISQ